MPNSAQNLSKFIKKRQSQGFSLQQIGEELEASDVDLEVALKAFELAGLRAERIEQKFLFRRTTYLTIVDTSAFERMRKRIEAHRQNLHRTNGAEYQTVLAKIQEENRNDRIETATVLWRR